MTSAELIALYDRDERHELDEPAMRREVADGVVRLVDQVGAESMVVFSDLDSRTADLAIRQQAAYFDQLGHRLEWKLYAHDRPADLHQRLIRHGFRAEPAEAIMMIDLSQISAELLEPTSGSIRQATDAALLQDAICVYGQVWPEKAGRLSQRLSHLLRHHPERLAVYVAYVGGKPVSAARVHFSPKSAFASLCGGATLPAFRRRGLYTELLSTRLRHAQRVGARFVTIDASAMSQSIVSRHGFRLVTFAQAHIRDKSAQRGRSEIG